MNVLCPSCAAKYAVPDEKVRGRKVKITCKRCQSPIIVDGTARGAAAGGPTSPSASAAPPAAPPPATPALAAPAPADHREPTLPSAAAPSPTAAAASQSPFEKARAAAPASRPPGGGPGSARAGAGGAAAPSQPPGSVGSAKRTALGGLQAPGAPEKVAAAAARNPRPLGAGPSPSTAPPRPAEAAGAKKTMLGGLQAPAAARGAAAPRAAAVAPAPAAPPAGVPAPEAPPPAPKWTVAVTDDDHRDLSLPEIIDAYTSGRIDHETFVWREGMDDWLTPFEVAEIGAALRARGVAPPGEGAAAAWREPAKWAAPSDTADTRFDDQTVSMDAPLAEALLRKASQDEPGLPEEPREAPAVHTARTLPPPPEAAPAPAARSPRPSPAVPSPRPSPVDVPRAAPAAAAGHRAAAPPRRPSVPDLSGEGEGAQGAARSDEPHEHAATGARNESSVLFSLDQLTGAAARPKAAAKPAEDLLGMGRGALADDGPPDSLVQLTGGGLFGAALAAPDFTAPVVEAPPPPALLEAPELGAPAASPAEASAPKGRAGLIVAALVGVLGLGAVAAWQLGVFGGAPAPAATGSAARAAEEAAPAALPEPPEPTEPVASASAAPAGSVAAAPSATATDAPPKAGGEAKPPEDERRKEEDRRKEEERRREEEERRKAEKPEGEAPAKPTEAPPAELPPFDRAAAAAALGAAAGSVGGCKKDDGPTGSGRVAVTFAPSGRATNAVVSGELAGTTVGGCVARLFRAARVPAFSGEAVTVGKSFSVQ